MATRPTGMGMPTLTPEEQGLTYDPNYVPDPNRQAGTYGGYTAAGGPTFTREGLGIPAGMGRLGGGGGSMGVVGGGGMGGGGGAGVLSGANPNFWTPESGGVPNVTNPINTILGNMGGITGIQTGLTDNALELLRNQYGPGYFATLEQLRRNTDRRAHGDISDLLPEKWQTNAENAVGGGYSGSAQENTKRLRDIALTRYGVENEAANSLAKIFGMTPTVQPQDMTGIIGALVGAQRDADIYSSAPDPNAAYNRAMRNAGSGGGGGGGATGGVTYRGGGGGAGKVDDVLSRMGGNVFGPPIIARGTKAPDYYSGPAPYGSIPYGDSADSYVPPQQQQFALPDFGGSEGYGGGLPWGGGAFGGEYTPGNIMAGVPGGENPMFDLFGGLYGSPYGAPPIGPIVDNNDWGMDPFGGSMGDAGAYDFPGI